MAGSYKWNSTPEFHSGNSGSIPLPATNQKPRDDEGSIAYTLMKKQVLMNILAWVLITAVIGTLTVVFYNVSVYAAR